MDHRDKLLKKALDSGELRPEEFITLARRAGMEVIAPSGGGSHYGLYLGASKRIGTVKLPGSGFVKRIYVKRLLELIEQLEPAPEQLRKEEETGESEED